MQACQHRPFECIQVSYRNFCKCITNYNRLTTVAHVIDALLDNLGESSNYTNNDCCLFVEKVPYLYPLKSTDFVQDVLLRYAPECVQFKLSFKRNSSPSRFAQRKRILRTPVSSNPVNNAFEQLRIQESVIRRQQQIIHELRKTTSHRGTSSSRTPSNYENYLDWISRTDVIENSDHSGTSIETQPISTRVSRQDQHREKTEREQSNPGRSLSRVRFRPPVISERKPMSPVFDSSSHGPMKSILKKTMTNIEIQRPSSVDRDIERLTSLKFSSTDGYASDDDQSEQSTTDSCLGSLSSNDSSLYLISQAQLETLV